jgi:hypothetical protein
VPDWLYAAWVGIILARKRNSRPRHDLVIVQFSHPNPGFEFDWLAVDSAGLMAIFSSGGHGPVPKRVVDGLAAVETAIEHLRLLPVVGMCAESPPGGGNYEFWTEPARRGLFGFDWGPVSDGPYVRLTVPSHPVRVGEVDDQAIQAAARLVVLPIDFRNVLHVEIEDLAVELYTGR